MKLKNTLLGTAVAATVMLAGAMSHQADAALIATIDGNDCSGVFGQGFGNCAYNGSPIIIKFNTGGAVEINTALFPTITGAEFSFSPTASGTWTYTPGAGDPVITAYVAKGGNSFIVFSNDGDPNSGVWLTPNNNGGNQAGLSHLSFYDTRGSVGVPEPASMLIFGAALLGLGAAARRRKDHGTAT